MIGKNFFGCGQSNLGMIYLEKFAGVAQLVEQLICNQPVGSSSLSTSFCKMVLNMLNLFGAIFSYIVQ
jgi:hypothetical protein